MALQGGEMLLVALVLEAWCDCLLGLWRLGVEWEEPGRDDQVGSWWDLEDPFVRVSRLVSRGCCASSRVRCMVAPSSVSTSTAGLLLTDGFCQGRGVGSADAVRGVWSPGPVGCDWACGLRIAYGGLCTGVIITHLSDVGAGGDRLYVRETACVCVVVVLCFLLDR